MIELNHLTKKFGDLVAVDDLSLKVERGEFFAVLGPNAAGKTTLIRVLAGLLKPTAGTARVAGFDVQADPLEARRRLAYVPDFPFLYDKLTPWEFLRFTGHVFQMSESRIQEASRALVPVFISNRSSAGPSRASRTARASGWPSSRPCCTTRKSLLLTNRWSAWTRNTRAWSRTC
jgi:ABC-type Na+ transport system ATPase subunit NatA